MRERCPRCQTFPEDWVDDEGFPLERPRFMAMQLRCHGCEATTIAHQAMPNTVKGGYVALVPFSDDVEEFVPLEPPDED